MVDIVNNKRHVLRIMIGITPLLIKIFIIVGISAMLFQSGFFDDVTANNGSGTVEDPYRIEDIYGLQNISDDLSAHYILVQDINASATIEWNDGDGFQPIGDELYRQFNGTLDGQAHAITGLFIGESSMGLVGLFGTIDSEAIVSNISLLNVNIFGGDYDVGGIVGENFHGTVVNCTVSGWVEGYQFVGGLAGSNWGSVLNSSSSARVKGVKDVGGLIGVNHYGDVINSSASGDVKGEENIGGLIGVHTKKTVEGCSAFGNVEGIFQVGSLIGECNKGDVVNCVATGRVSGDEYVGGLIGINRNEVIVGNSSASGWISGKDYVGGLIGKNSGIVNNSHATGAVSGNSTVGGLIGMNIYASLDYCTATGEVSGNNNVGEFVGWGDGSAVDETSKNEGFIPGFEITTLLLCISLLIASKKNYQLFNNQPGC